VSGEVVHTAEAYMYSFYLFIYPGFRSIKWLEVFLLPPGWDSSQSQNYPQH